ncbi:MAG: ATP-binding protein [Lentisphaeraceae bacterium]|nr:ATP-binding protein [Lentisphaeraceae bacterium]
MSLARLTFIISGALIGVFVLFPFNEALYYFEHIRHDLNTPKATEFIKRELIAILSGSRPYLLFFYASLGAILSLSLSIFHSKLIRNIRLVEQMSEELSKDVLNLISQGEGPFLEFKSSLRWDYRQEKINKALDLVIMKTIAGFMNTNGGTLLIGVDDDQNILGLENDFSRLKKANEDGFELTFTSLLTSNFGTNFCRHANVVFHDINDKKVCRVIVTKSHKPAYLKHENKLKLFIRTGGSTRELNIQEAVEYVSSHWTKK